MKAGQSFQLRGKEVKRQGLGGAESGQNLFRIREGTRARQQAGGEESKAESKAQRASPRRDNHSGEAEEDPSEGRGRLV